MKHLTSKYTSHRSEDFFLVQLLVKVFFYGLNEIKETHKIQAQGIQERLKCFQCNYWQTKDLDNTELHNVRKIQLFIFG